MSEKASGLRQPSKIGRPCCALTPKPAVPPSPPRSSSMNSMEPIYENPNRKTSAAGLRRESDTSVILTEDTDSFIIGDRIWVGGTKPGSIAFIGETKFAPGEWAGVVLDEPIGKNDGSVAGTRYYQCAPKHGIFSRLTRLTRYPLTDASLVSPSGIKSPLSPESRLNKSVSPSLNTSTTSLSSTATPRDLKLGDRVIVSSSQGSKTGVLRYIGETEFAAGEWCGVELDDAVGKNDGSVGDKRYFECRPKHGLFAPLHKVTRSPSSKRSSMCAVHKPSGAALNSSMRRMGSRESLVSVSSMASTTTSTATRGATSTTRKTGLRTSQPVRSTLQETLKEKQQEIEMLKKERDLERERITKAANQADFAEQTKANLKKEYDKYRDDMEKKVIEIQNAMATLNEEKSHLSGLLEEEKQKCEDLLFRFEEESVNKEDIQKDKTEQDVINILNENKIRELESQLTEERERVIQLERENTKLFEVEEELAKIRSEKADYHELQNRNLCLEEAKITLEKEVLERNDSIDQYLNQIKQLEAQLNSKELEQVAVADQETSLQKNYDDIKKSLDEKSVLIENMKKEHAATTESMLHEIEELKKTIENTLKLSLSEKESIIADYQKIIAEKDEIIQLKAKEIEEESMKQKDAQSVALERQAIENSSQMNELSTKVNEQLAEKDQQIESLTKDLEECSSKLERILNDFTNHKSLTVKKEEELETALRELRELNAKLESATMSKNELKEEINTLKSQNMENFNLMNEDKKKLKESLTSLQTSATTFSMQLENVNADLKSKQIELEELQKSKATAIEELTRDFQSKLEEKEKCITEISEDVTQKLMRLHDLEKEVVDLKSQLTAKDEEIKPLLEKTSELKDAITLSEQTKTNLESELRMYEVSIAESNQKMSHAEEKISQLVEQKNKLEADIATAISTSADSSDQLMKYNEELRSKEKELDELRERTFHLEKLMTSSEAKMHRAEEELKASNQALEQYKSESGELKEQLDAQERHKEELIIELNSLRMKEQEIAEIVRNQALLQTELETKNQIIEDLTKKLKTVEENVSSLKEECSLLSSSNEEQAEVLRTRCEELEHKLVVSQEQMNSLQENEMRLLTENTQKDNSIKVLNEKLSSLTESNTNLEKLLTERESEVTNLKHGMDELEKGKAIALENMCNEKQRAETEMLTLSNSIKDLQNRSEESKAESKRNIGELKALLDERIAMCCKFEQEIAETMRNNSKLQEEKAEHLKTIETIREDKLSLEAKVKLMESELHSVQNELEVKVKIIDDLRNSVETLKMTDQQSLKDSELALDIKIKKLRSAFATTTKKLDVVETGNLSQCGVIEVLKAEANKREEDIAHLQQEKLTMKTELKALSEAQEERNRAFQVEETEMKALSEQIKKLESANQILEKDRLEVGGKLKLLLCSTKNNEEASLKSIQSLTEELNTLKAKSAQWRDNESRLELENKQLNTKLIKTQEELKTLSENKKNITEMNSQTKIIVTAPEDSAQSPNNNIEFQKMCEDNEMYRSQIDFLNSVIVDMQKKNEKLLCKVEVLEMGMPANEADDYSRITLDNKGAAPRMFCDICDQFDLHETEDCPKQSQDFDVDKPQTKSAKKPAAERPYCETCEMFGHDTADCDDAETF